jgi:C-terminal processing protease CtpA/Prc
LGPQPFHNKTVLLVNEWTNSAAEMVGGFAAENGLASIVAKKTTGNVHGAANFKVGSGYWVGLLIFGWYTSKGNALNVEAFHQMCSWTSIRANWMSASISK